MKNDHEIYVLLPPVQDELKIILELPKNVGKIPDSLYVDRKDRIYFFVQEKKGESKKLSTRYTVAYAIHKIKEEFHDIAIVLPKGKEEFVYDVILGIGIGHYEYSWKPKNKKQNKYYVYYQGRIKQNNVARAQKILWGQYIARDLANSPPNIVNPDTLYDILLQYRKLLRVNLEISQLDEEKIKKEGLNGIISVGKGSRRKPKLIIMEYRGDHKNNKAILLVGKTVTFDSGGLDLKSREAMDEMKFDKSGGCTVAGIVFTAALLKMKKNIIALLPTVENLPGPESYIPREIIRMYNGKTVEVNNTDAEGRLILADAISYGIKKYSPQKIIDIATLTGAVVIALGNQAAGIFGTDEEVLEKLSKIEKETGERFWKLPLYEEYKEALKSEIADLLNSGGREGGASIGAMFLREFTENTPWTHIDVAGVAWVQKKGPKKEVYKHGATAWSLESLIYILS